MDWDEVARKFHDEPSWQEERDRDVQKRAQARGRGRPTKPLTENHKKYIQAVQTHTITLALGPAGTGKTTLACEVAVKLLRSREVEQIVLTRPLVECGEKLGTLPGTIDERTQPYLAPMAECFKELLGAGEFDKLKRSGVIDICPLATMRGRTFHNSFVILDEAQNALRLQLRMFLTRMGENSHFVVNGDTRQHDLRGESPLVWVTRRLEATRSAEIAIVRFNRADCLRPELVQLVDEALEDECESPPVGSSPGCILPDEPVPSYGSMVATLGRQSRNNSAS